MAFHIDLPIKERISLQTGDFTKTTVTAPSTAVAGSTVLWDLVVDNISDITIDVVKTKAWLQSPGVYDNLKVIDDTHTDLEPDESLEWRGNQFTMPNQNVTILASAWVFDLDEDDFVVDSAHSVTVIVSPWTLVQTLTDLSLTPLVVWTAVQTLTDLSLTPLAVLAVWTAVQTLTDLSLTPLAVWTAVQTLTDLSLTPLAVVVWTLVQTLTDLTLNPSGLPPEELPKKRVPWVPIILVGGGIVLLAASTRKP